MSRLVGEENAMRVFTEGNYLSDGQPDPTRQKMRPEMITQADDAEARRLRSEPEAPGRDMLWASQPARCASE